MQEVPDRHPGTASHRVAVDVGGTFIDVVSVDDETGGVTVEKQPAVPDRLAEEMLISLQRLQHPAASISRFFHGSTVALNAILERRGATVGLITTQGFRDVLELGRGARREIYDWLATPPDPLVPRRRRREVRERTSADGSVTVPIDLDELDREVDGLVASGVDALAVCFLHSYANPKNEAIAAQRIRERYPDLRTTISSEVASEWREYERTSTTVLNAFVQPMFARYLEVLADGLRSLGCSRPVAVMQSNGGAMESSRAAALPVRTLMSGPAGGAIGGRALAHELGIENMICCDVGGTSFDVTLIESGDILERSESSLAGLPVLAPFIDVASVGTGGGSVAWIDPTGALRVGPRSVGAYPGPACFGRGGSEPSVTDAQLVLGRLDAERFLGSRMPLDVDAAHRALRDAVATPMGTDVMRAAGGVVTIAEASMSDAVHAVTVERGLDPRDFVLLSYGGAGGLFAATVAEGLEIPRVMIPREPANFSAWGILASDFREDASLTRVRPLDAVGVSGIRGDLTALSQQVTEDLHLHGFELRDIVVELRVDLRFYGQEHTVPVPIEHALLEEDEETLLDHLRDRFVSLHRRLFGHGDGSASVEAVTSRCRAIGPVGRPRWPAWTVERSAEPRTHRPVHHGREGSFDTPIFDRDAMAAGQKVYGPAVIEEWSTTILVPPDWSAAVDRLGNLVMEIS